MSADFPAEVSLQSYYDSFKRDKQKYSDVRWLKLGGVKGVVFREASPESPDDPQRLQWIAYRNSRVKSYSQYTMFDAPTWQGGLRFANRRKKPGVYSAFALPLRLERKSGGRIEVFGAVRAASSGEVEGEFKATRRASYRSIGSIPVNRVGYFRRTFRVKAFSGATFRSRLWSVSSSGVSPC